MASIAEAHAALLRTGTLQFDLPAASEAPAEAATPLHLSLGFGHVDVVWVLAALAAAGIAALVVAYLRNRPPAQAAPSRPVGDGATVTPAAARAALGDADAFAAAGRYLDAAHALLACGVGAIAERHPGALRPTTTSRDLAADAGLPEPLRVAFGRIAAAVEVGLFGGRPVGAADYAECRRIFTASALSRFALVDQRKPAQSFTQEKRDGVDPSTPSRLAGRA